MGKTNQNNTKLGLLWDKYTALQKLHKLTLYIIHTLTHVSYLNNLNIVGGYSSFVKAMLSLFR